MKGVVFTELIEMVESTFSVDTMERVLEASTLPSGGVYTSLGTYSHREVLELVTHLSEEVSVPVADLVYAFGRHLFRQFHAGYGHMLAGVDDTFTLLERIEDDIHVEVRKLYVDAQLPSIDAERISPDQLQLTYRSTRPFAMLAQGLIDECIAHFNETIDVEMQDLSEGAGTSAQFVLTRRT